MPRHLAPAGLLALLASVMVSPVLAGDHANGETIYNRQCSYCHDLTRKPADRKAFPGESFQELRQQTQPRPALPEEPVRAGGALRDGARRGPNLSGLLSRPPGAEAGFPYRFVWHIDGPVWTDADLDRYIEFHARLGPEERADLIAYLERATRN
ncbi:MAG: c-type cytochrome [Rhodospirillales bacterium]|nr:c-type cytochrome [Rhodospirillales bacterium]